MTVMQSVPIIDVSDIRLARSKVTKEIMKAACEVGFFQISGHGIPQEIIDAQFESGKSYLALPEAVKKNFEFQADTYTGWQSKDIGGELRESIEVGNTRYPKDDEAQDFVSSSKSFMAHCQALCAELLICLAEGTGQPSNLYREAMRDDDAYIFLHYPPVDGKVFPEGALRLSAHTDFGLITLLFQRPGMAGLEVCPGRKASKDFGIGDEWLPCDPVEGAITVNLGDLLMYWTDDVVMSNYHRVRVPRPDEYQGDRYSMAFFVGARNEILVQGPSKKYPPIRSGDIMAAQAVAFEKQQESGDPYRNPYGAPSNVASKVDTGSIPA